MTWPTLTLEVAFAADATASSPTFSNVSSRLLDFGVSRGRQMELDQTETGQLTAVLDNQDRALEPTNTAGAYYPNVVPVRQARMTANVLSVDYPILRGDIPDWPQDWQGRTNRVPVTMVDGFDALAGAEFSASRPEELSGARVGAILDAVGWQAGLRAIDAGQSLLQPLEYENANALAALQDVAEWEYGVVFMSRDGNVVFHNRQRRWLDTTLRATFSNDPSGGEFPLSDAKVVYRRERIKNSVFIAQGGGATYSAEDATSKARFRRRSLSKTVYLSDANEVQEMANYLLLAFKDPVVRVEEVMIEPGQDDNLWQHALGREIGDRIRVKIRAPGSPSAIVTSDVTIEGASHTVNGAAKRWQTTFRCSPSNALHFWILDTDVLETAVGY